MDSRQLKALLFQSRFIDTKEPAEKADDCHGFDSMAHLFLRLCAFLWFWCSLVLFGHSLSYFAELLTLLTLCVSGNNDTIIASSSKSSFLVA